MTNQRLTIFGGSGFISSEIVFRLSKHFKEVRVLTRNIDKCNPIKVIKNVEIYLYDPRIVNTFTTHLKESDVVINTVGILNEDKNNTFQDIHYNFVRSLLNKSKEHGISKFIHLSALNANQNGPSIYLQTKGLADDFIKNQSAKTFTTVIFRPSIVFGDKDSFFNRFKKLLQIFPIFPLACPNSKFSPIYVKDLVDFIEESVLSDIYDNSINNVTGPKNYTFLELINFILAVLEIKRVIIPLNHSLSKLQAIVFNYLPGNIFTLDNFKSLQIDNISSDGLKGKSTIENIVPSYLVKNNNKIKK